MYTPDPTCGRTTILARLVIAFMTAAAASDALAAGNGGSPSEPLPSQNVCAKGMWVVQKNSEATKEGTRVVQLFGIPRERQTTKFTVAVKTDVPATMFYAGAPISSGRIELDTNTTAELAFRPSTGGKQIKATLTFFDEATCSEVVSVSFP